MAATYPVKVTDVTHWNDKLFSFKTERAREFRFETGQFTMIGLTVDGKPLLRAYSIASASYDDHLEFLSIKVPDGPLTLVFAIFRSVTRFCWVRSLLAHSCWQICIPEGISIYSRPVPGWRRLWQLFETPQCMSDTRMS